MFTSISPFVGVQELCSRILVRLLVFRSCVHEYKSVCWCSGVVFTSISPFVGVQELCSRVLARLLVFRSCVHEY